MRSCFTICPYLLNSRLHSLGLDLWLVTKIYSKDLEPLAKVQRALLVVEVLELPQPELGGLLGGGNGGEHLLQRNPRQRTPLS